LNAANESRCDFSGDKQKRYEDFRHPDSNIYRRTDGATFPEDRRSSKSLSETVSTGGQPSIWLTLAKTELAARKAGRNGRAEKTLYLSVPTGFRKTDQRVVL
jgi:hypothetical protein